MQSQSDSQKFESSISQRKYKTVLHHFVVIVVPHLPRTFFCKKKAERLVPVLGQRIWDYGERSMDLYATSKFMSWAEQLTIPTAMYHSDDVYDQRDAKFYLEGMDKYAGNFITE